jgi:hypothetical protein
VTTEEFKAWLQARAVARENEQAAFIRQVLAAPDRGQVSKRVMLGLHLKRRRRCKSAGAETMFEGQKRLL